jgi:putative transposase
MTPRQKFSLGIFGDDENPGTGLPPIVEDRESIKIALLPAFYRTVQKDGITLDGITYYSDVLRTWINRDDEQGNKLKFKVKRDPLSIQKLYFFDPELKEYFELSYRKLHAPDMTVWDLYAAKRYLKENSIKDTNEDDLFDAYERLIHIEKQAKEKTAKHKMRKSKAPKMSDIKLKVKTETQVAKEKKNKQTDDVFHDLFDNIETFHIKE